VCDARGLFVFRLGLGIAPLTRQDRLREFAPRQSSILRCKQTARAHHDADKSKHAYSVTEIFHETSKVGDGVRS
jgi:hypothetical protein